MRKAELAVLADRVVLFVAMSARKRVFNRQT